MAWRANVLEVEIQLEVKGRWSITLIENGEATEKQIAGNFELGRIEGSGSTVPSADPLAIQDVTGLSGKPVITLEMRKEILEAFQDKILEEFRKRAAMDGRG